jgi:hypothetical protein
VWSAEEVRLSEPGSGLIADLHDDHVMHWGVFDGSPLVGAAAFGFAATVIESPDGELFISGFRFPLRFATTGGRKE